MPWRSVVSRSTSRISDAVRAFITEGPRKKLKHPAAANVHDLSGDIFSFLGGEERNGCGDIVHSARAANRKPRVLDTARFVEPQFFFVNARRIHDVHRDAVLSLFQRQ